MIGLEAMIQAILPMTRPMTRTAEQSPWDIVMECRYIQPHGVMGMGAGGSWDGFQEERTLGLGL